MKFVASWERFNSYLQLVKQAAANKSIQPVLSNVLIEALDNGIVKLSTTDNDIYMQASFPATVEESGKISVNARKISEVVAKLDGESISLNSNSSLGGIDVKCGSTNVNMVGISAEEFPNIPFANFEPQVEVSVSTILTDIKQTTFAAATYDTNSVLSGVFVKINEKSIETVATDGSRLSLKKSENLSNSKSVSAIIPARALNELVRIYTGCNDSKLQILLDDKFVYFKFSDRYLVSALLEGQYPQYDQLLPTSYSTVAIIDRQPFIGALERASVMANERTNIVKFVFSSKSLNITANTPDIGGASDDLEIEYSGDEELKIAFNYKYVLDALKAIGTDKIRMEFSGGLSPTLIKPAEEENYVSLVMPVQVK